MELQSWTRHSGKHLDNQRLRHSDPCASASSLLRASLHHLQSYPITTRPSNGGPSVRCESRQRSDVNLQQLHTLVLDSEQNKASIRPGTVRCLTRPYLQQNARPSDLWRCTRPHGRDPICSTTPGPGNRPVNVELLPPPVPSPVGPRTLDCHARLMSFFDATLRPFPNSCACKVRGTAAGRRPL